MEKVKILSILLLSIFIAACNNDDDEYTGISDYAKELGLKEVAVNQDANSSEICYFVKENGDSITLIGNKDENGCVSNIYMMKYKHLELIYLELKHYYFILYLHKMYKLS